MKHEEDELRALFRAALAEECPSDVDKRAVRKALSTALGVGIGTATSGVSAATLGSTSSWGQALASALFGGKFLGGLLVGAALGTAVTTTVHVVESKRVRSQLVNSKVTEAHIVASKTLASASLLEGPRPSAATSQVVPEEPAPHEIGPRDHKGPNSSRPSDPELSASSNRDTLLVETKALAAVQSALDQGDSGAALRLLKEQDRAFSAGQLAEERAAARVLALCAAGRHEEARLGRERFVADYPDSPLAKRIRKGCGQ